MKNLLTIAGSDSCGGAGIQADLKTFSALGTYGMSVITAVTAQNTQGVVAIREMDAEMVKEQIQCLLEDIPIDGIKIGMVSSIEIIHTIADILEKAAIHTLVVDPVMISKSGANLLRPESQEALIQRFFPLALIVTPNLHEAEAIIGEKIETLGQMECAAEKIHGMGAKHVLVKGGHLMGDAIDVYFDGIDFRHLPGKRIETKNTHGTGCTFSSAIAAYVAKGNTVAQALVLAKEYIQGAIEHSFALGKGVGPTHHFFNFY